MSRTGQADPELDSLIAEITIDCHDEDEALSAFENAFDEEASFPIPGAVVGEDIELLSVGNEQRPPRADRHLPTRRTSSSHRPTRHQHPPRPTRLTPARRLPPLARRLTTSPE
jgi:hypothetical protein